MHPCPFCAKPLHSAESGGLPHELCGDCGAVWFELGTLSKLLGEAASHALVEQARGKPGQCKSCQGTLEYVPSCPACGTSAPRCPPCGTAPLAVTLVTVARVAEVPVDVCTRCHGVALEAGKLEVLQQPSGTEHKILREPPLDRPEPPEFSASACAGCGRELKPQHAFGWEDRVWCGSCAPSGASPVELRLTARDSNVVDPDLSGVLHHGRTGAGLGVAGDAVNAAFPWLFSKLMR